MEDGSFYDVGERTLEISRLLRLARAGRYPRTDVCADLITMYLSDGGQAPEAFDTSQRELDAFVRTGALAGAKERLAQMARRLHCYRGRCDDLAENIRSLLNRANAGLGALSYKGYRLDETLLDHMVRGGWRNEARNLWREIRIRSLFDDVHGLVAELRLALSEAGARLSDIGVSEPALLSLMRRGFLASASHWWNSANKSLSRIRALEDVGMMRESLRKAKADMTAIGVTPAEVAALLRRPDRTNGVETY